MAFGYKKDGKGGFVKKDADKIAMQQERTNRYTFRRHSEETMEMVFARIASGERVNKVAKETGIPLSTIHYWLHANPQKFEEIRANKKIEFIHKSWDAIFQAMNLSLKKIRRAVEDTSGQDNISLKEISTFIGILYDKQAMASGEPITRSDNYSRVAGTPGAPIEVNMGGMSKEEMLAFIAKVAEKGAKPDEPGE